MLNAAVSLATTPTARHVRFWCTLQAFLHDDWLDVTSRPFVQGPVDALLDNDYLARLLAADRELRDDVDTIINNVDYALRKVRCRSSDTPPAYSLQLG